MKPFSIFLLCSAFFLTSCGNNLTSSAIAPTAEATTAETTTPKPVLIIIGEGGPSGSMFQRAADTYAKEKQGDRYTVHSGDEFVAAMRDYVSKHGPIQHLEYFGHGNSVGLYINQAPNINGALYANDPRVDKDYIAASIYELPADTFVPGGSIRFNGCNVAEGHPEGKPNLAQNFVNYFHITAEAPLGPTEFSQVPDRIKPYANSGSLGTEFRGPVYLVPTDPERGFIPITPETPLVPLTDIYTEANYAPDVSWLLKNGWTPEKIGWKTNVEPWKNVTYQELLAMCQFFSPTSSACEEIKQYPEDTMVRNLAVLSTIMDAAGLPVTTKKTNPWYQKYISYGMEHTLLTNDFIHKKWYTRAELLELSGKVGRHQESLLKI